MKKEDIHLGDIKRILLGEAPPEFLLEVVFRSVFLYILLLVTLRLLGKRMGALLTITEMAVMVTLGAIIAPPMQMPDKGLLLGATVLFMIFMLHRLITYLTVKSTKVEEAVQGIERVIVKDGVINVNELMKVRLTHQQLYAILREKGLHNLGQVKRVYLEGCGLFSVFPTEKPRAGLSILPPSDLSIHTSEESAMIHQVCEVCGTVKTSQSRHTCENCHANNWTAAVI